MCATSSRLTFFLLLLRFRAFIMVALAGLRGIMYLDGFAASSTSILFMTRHSYWVFSFICSIYAKSEWVTTRWRWLKSPRLFDSRIQHGNCELYFLHSPSVVVYICYHLLSASLLLPSVVKSECKEEMNRKKRNGNIRKRSKYPCEEKVEKWKIASARM